MAKIVTIDFDIVMAPSIELYNNFSHSSWEERYERHPLLKLANADFTIYHKLTQYLLWLVPKMKKENIHFIFDHHSILNYIDNKTEPLDIINIDHHHDIKYAEGLEKLTCGNWLTWIDNNFNLNSYLWVYDNNSHFPKPEDEKNNYQKENFSSYSNTNFKNFSIPDKLIICLSGEWVPPQYKPLFYTWFDICNQIHNTHYDFEDANK